MLKKFFLSFICVSYVITSCFIFEDNVVNADDIEIVVLSGDGTSENPYELGECELKDILDNRVKRSINNTNEGSSNYAIYANSLTGSRHYAKDGGIWTYSSGGNVAYNGQFIYMGISYNNGEQCATLSSSLNNSTQLERILVYLAEGYAGKTLATKLTSLLGATKAGIIGGIFAFVYYNYNPTTLHRNMLDKASNEGKGVMEIRYKTSYNGQWYYTTIFEYWDSYPYAYEPGSNYGIGSYNSK